MFAPVTELLLTAQTPSYKTVLALDKKVRDKTLPSHFNTPASIDDASFPSRAINRHLFVHLRTVCLMYIHRSFFARALLDHPTNPLRSPYAPSVLSAYQCASLLIRDDVKFVEQMPDLAMRWSILWSHLFSAAVCGIC